MSTNNNLDSSAIVAPNIFDAYLNPDLLLTLILGNLLSDQLWLFNERVQRRLGKFLSDASDLVSPADPLLVIKAIQYEIDHQFSHVHQNDYAGLYGELNLKDEASRLGRHSMDVALEKLNLYYNSNVQTHNLPPGVQEQIKADLAQDRFPAVYYTNFDVIRAQRLLRGGHKANASMGLTSCLDEVCIFAALTMLQPIGVVENVIALSCLRHYSAFGWDQNGECWWFYGKNKLFSSKDWKQLVDEQFEGDAQAAFNQRLADFDTITSVAGTFDLTDATSSIPADHIDTIVAKLDVFFGCRLEQLSAALAKPRRTTPEAPVASILRELLGTQSLENARARLLRADDPICQQVLYSYRTLHVNDLFPYLSAARYNPNTKLLGLELKSVKEAIEVVRSLEGNTSFFKDRMRLAMPDETLRLRTGSDIDKGLLLHVLIEHFHQAISCQDHLTTQVTDTDSYVCGHAFCISISTMTMTTRPSEGVRMTFSSPNAL